MSGVGLTYYYSKGSSALAAHILLKEVKATYVTQEISIPDGAHLAPDFLAINPKGLIPALQTPDGVLTENPAILEYIASAHPTAGMVPQGIFVQAKARELCAYLCATAHVAFAHTHRGNRWADGAAAHAAMQAKVPSNLRDCAAFLEATLPLTPWAIGDTYSYADPYLFLMGRWLAAHEIDIAIFPRLAAHHRKVLARAATQTALAKHGLS